MIIIPIWIYKWGIFNDHHITYRSPILFPSDKSWEAALLDSASRRLRQLCDMRAPQWAKATEILSVEKPVEKMAVGGPENQEKPWENREKPGKPGKTRKN